MRDAFIFITWISRLVMYQLSTVPTEIIFYESVNIYKIITCNTYLVEFFGKKIYDNVCACAHASSHMCGNISATHKKVKKKCKAIPVTGRGGL
jgi:hypothetical protein